MFRRSLQVASLVAVSFTGLTTALLAQDAKSIPTPPPSAAAVVDRGRYIVEDVALCGRCHTPVDGAGKRDRFRWLMGGQVALENPLKTAGDWAIVAPRLAGAPPGTDAEFITLMMTGVSRRGHPLREPMPQFRLTRADAEAVLAYLKAVGPRQHAELSEPALTRR